MRTAGLGAALLLAGGLIGWILRAPSDPTKHNPPPGPHTSTASHTVNYPQPKPDVEPKPFRVPTALESNEPAPIATAASLAAELRSGAARCPEGSRTRLYLLDEEKLLLNLPNSEAVSSLGGVPIADGRHVGELGLPLVRLLDRCEGATALEVWPAAGEARTFTAKELSAAPGRYLIAVNRRGACKLIDADAEYRALFKNLAGIRVVR